MKTPILEMKHIRKTFASTVALGDVDLNVYPGEIRGLIGENGSGKSTISSIAAGMQKADSGEMLYHGEAWNPSSMIDALSKGIGMIVQESGTIQGVSVAENLFLGEMKQFPGKLGMIDRKGREVFPIKYEILTSMYEGHLFAGDDDGLALYNNRFEPLTKPVYTELVGKSEERILVKRDGKYGYLDNNGKEIIPCQYDNAGMFKDSRAYVSRNGKWGIIDRMGNAVLPIEYDNSGYRGEAYIYHDGLALVEKDHLYGYADINGNLIIYPCFQNAYQFSDGLAPVFIGLWGYIDTKGDFFIPPVFDIAGPFSWGRAEVIYHGEIHKMNTEGQCVKNCKNAPKSWR